MTDVGVTADVTGQIPESLAWFDRASRVLVEGVSSPSRGAVNYGVPRFMTRGAGSRLYDVDGHEYLDLMMGYGALVHGHAHPALIEALTTAAQAGTMFATADPLEVELAERLVELTPGVDQVPFANTGTEAVMAAIRLARGVTGRRTIIKFEGHYHGWYDAVLLNGHPALPHQFGDPRDPIPLPDSSGLTPGSLADTRIAPWGDPDAVETLLRSGQVACVLSEPAMANIGVIPPPPGFLPALAELCNRYGTLFILDETVTGFRLRPGGAAELYGVVPDLVTFGKALGAGLPVAALAGKREVMGGLSWGRVLHYGTQNAPHLGLAVALASLELLTADAGRAFDQMGVLGDRLTAGLQSAFADAGVAAVAQNVGPMVQVFLLTEDATAAGVDRIRDFRDFCRYCDRDRFRRFAHFMIDRGVYLSPAATLHSIISTQTSESDVDLAVSVARDAAHALSSS